MNSIIKEGLVIGAYGISITFAVLAFLGFVLFLFKFIFKTPSSEEEENTSEFVTFEEQIPEEKSEKKKLIAIAIAISQYLSSKAKATKKETRFSFSKRDISKSIKAKRWKNG